jgi:MFS family permease
MVIGLILLGTSFAYAFIPILPEIIEGGVET